MTENDQKNHLGMLSRTRATGQHLHSRKELRKKTTDCLTSAFSQPTLERHQCLMSQSRGHVIDIPSCWVQANKYRILRTI